MSNHISPITPKSPFDLPLELQLNIFLQCCDSYDSLISTIEACRQFRPLLCKYPFTVLSHIVRQEIELFADEDKPEDAVKDDMNKVNDAGSSVHPARDRKHRDNGRSITIHALLLLCIPVLGFFSDGALSVDEFLKRAPLIRSAYSAEDELLNWLWYLCGYSPYSDDTVCLDGEDYPEEPWNYFDPVIARQSGMDLEIFLTQDMVDLMIENHLVFREIYEALSAATLSWITDEIVIRSYTEKKRAGYYDEEAFYGCDDWYGAGEKGRTSLVLKRFPEIQEGLTMPISQREKHRVYQGIYGLAYFLDLHRLVNLISPSGLCTTLRSEEKEQLVCSLVWQSYSTIWQLEATQIICNYLEEKLHLPLAGGAEALRIESEEDRPFGRFAYLGGKHPGEEYRDRLYTPCLDGSVNSLDLHREFMDAYFRHLAFSHGLKTLYTRYYYDRGYNRVKEELLGIAESGLLMSCLRAGASYKLLPFRRRLDHWDPLEGRDPQRCLVPILRRVLERPHMTDKEKLQAIIMYCPLRRIALYSADDYLDGIHDFGERLAWIAGVCTGLYIPDGLEPDPLLERRECSLWDDERLKKWRFGFVQFQPVHGSSNKTHEDFWRLLDG
ncbi:hypothetical protein BJ508DRAFT_332985 [Ascobolus immersus RN42]|uniref:Uncharacterized protein n=1 Tax=Ascobolus immersus RN42 TaxID=1160509 RepID=A0A3N4HKY7_ASCIM|nr:hypothetical protein BJ508DRAFT_332985 [Ascobolus immersus RN42]